MVDSNRFSAGQKIAITALVYAVMLVIVQYIMNVGLREIRLAAFLPPLAGMVWGVPGAIGAALGNMARDVIVGEPLAVIPIGAATNFIFAYVPYRLWLATNLENSDDEYFAPTTKCLLRYFMLLVVSVGIGTVCLLCGLVMIGYEIPEYFAYQVFITNFDFPLVVTTPLFIILAGRGWVFPQCGGATLREEQPEDVARRPLSYSITLWVMMSCVLFISLFSAFAIIQKMMEGETDIIFLFNYLYSSQFLMVHLFFFGSLIFLRRAEKHLSEPLSAITKSIRAFARQSGKLSAVSLPTVESANELGMLKDSVGQMMDDIVEYTKKLHDVTKEQERIRAELSIAHEIQASMLPKIFPAYPGKKEIDLYATMQPAKEVGGDFYDFYLLDERHLVIVVADVAGKGVSASLFMVIAKTILKNFLLTAIGEDDLAAAVACTNDQLCQNNEALMFVTAFIGMLDIKTGRFVYVNAGHNPPVLYRAAEDACQYIKTKKTFVLGVMEGREYVRQECVFFPGDRLFLYTDGVTEALNESNDMYGEDRLLACLSQSCAGSKSCHELVLAVRDSLAAYVGGADQSDDITMMALMYRGKGGD